MDHIPCVVTSLFSNKPFFCLALFEASLNCELITEQEQLLQKDSGNIMTCLHYILIYKTILGNWKHLTV